MSCWCNLRNLRMAWLRYGRGGFNTEWRSLGEWKNMDIYWTMNNGQWTMDMVKTLYIVSTGANWEWKGPGGWDWLGPQRDPQGHQGPAPDWTGAGVIPGYCKYKLSIKHFFPLPSKIWKKNTHDMKIGIYIDEIPKRKSLKLLSWPPTPCENWNFARIWKRNQVIGWLTRQRWTRWPTKYRFDHHRRRHHRRRGHLYRHHHRPRHRHHHRHCVRPPVGCFTPNCSKNKQADGRFRPEK